ncbi:acyl-CoA synthetase subunit alpha [Candidatus Mancarchaeum acidiphilum]|uniref:Acyl-CoA synthetase subunit alpha n=1 Tax=Candidatus Mancarchaeum acidiphilum TaxID=1920749 RepID=A0A218NP04_9ARCH|nr:CoA-binding protein [Candidatus Mancarchaeum acidiphilum]ASI14202.1 acyl-CoA synthetase subunit alpha [Candidatus Mancarchaeum acidiphilum]
MENEMSKSIGIMMNPKSVAIIGASPDPDKVGYSILKNYLDLKYKGKLYPINLKEDSILGLKAYKSILDVPEQVDTAVIAVPAPITPNVLDECGRAKVKSVVVVTAGYAEVGNSELEEKLVSTAKKYNLPVLGPNCVGVMDLRTGVDTLFLPSYKFDRPEAGSLGFVSQSGSVAGTILDLIGGESIGLSKFVSYGNASVIDETDILNYLADDDDTNVLIVYLEGAKKSKDFIDVAKRIGKKKPVIIAKGGATAAGSKAAHSHTASMAGNYQIYEAIFEQAGFIQSNDLDEMMGMAKMFDKQPLPTGNRVGLITNGGGTGVLATDSIYRNGLALADLTDSSKEYLRKVMPPIVNIRTPLDIGGDADYGRFNEAIKTVVNDDNVDIVAIIALFQTPGADSRVAQAIGNYAAVCKKPMIVISEGGSYTEMHKKIIEQSGIPVYSSPEMAAKVMAAAVKYAEFRKNSEN